ncbi:hypothetical protein KI387_013401, partial [Taxus chinensis]
MKDADRPVWCKSVHFRRFGSICPRQFGTSGPKIREGRKKLEDPRANGILPHVFAAKRDKEARIGRFREICPRQFGTSRPKGREGCEKLGRSRGANQSRT